MLSKVNSPYLDLGSCLFQAAALQGNTEPILDEDVTPHFIALVNFKGRYAPIPDQESLGMLQKPFRLFKSRLAQ